MEKVSVIIALHNRVELTLRCLKSLSEFTRHPEWELIVIDNASGDGTAEALKALEGDIKVLTAAENLGYARANNWGAMEASGSLLCFLNNDTEVTAGWLKALVECLASHPAGAVCGGKLLFPEGTVQHAGVVFDKIDHIGYHIYRGLKREAPEVNRERKLKAVTGACMLVKRKAFEEAGGFDDEYINGFEDIDLCLKIGESGGEIYYTPRCEVYHHTSASAGRKDYDMQNVERFRRKWFSKIIPDEDSFLAEDGYRAEWKGSSCTLRKVTVDIIAPVFSGAQTVETLAENIGRFTGFPNYRVIFIVSDKSEFQRSREIDRRLRQSQVMEIRAGAGFAAACNSAAEKSEADYLVFLEENAEISEGWLTEMVKAAASVNVGAVSSGYCRKIKGRSLLVKRTVFNGLDGFDEGFLGRLAEVDLFFRIADSGLEVLSDLDYSSFFREGVFIIDHEKIESDRARFIDKWRHKLL